MVTTIVIDKLTKERLDSIKKTMIEFGYENPSYKDTINFIYTRYDKQTPTCPECGYALYPSTKEYSEYAKIPVGTLVCRIHGAITKDKEYTT